MNFGVTSSQPFLDVFLSVKGVMDVFFLSSSNNELLHEQTWLKQVVPQKSIPSSTLFGVMVLLEYKKEKVILFVT